MFPRMTVLRVLAASLALVMALFGLISAGMGKSLLHARSHRPATSAASRPAESPLPDRLALVIGNSNYPDADAPLPQMANDAGALANVLRKDHFLVEFRENATRADVVSAIDRLKAKVRPTSTVLVYFGGYGVQSQGQDYMVPIDAKLWYERDVRRDGISIDQVLSEFSGAHARLAVIDASRRNPYERRFRTYSHGLAPVQVSDNTLVLTSAAPDQAVDDSDGAHSRLMTALVREMNSSGSVQEAFDRTRAAVARETLNQQVPAIFSQMSDSVALDPTPGNAVSAADSESRRG
jgi:uncharacterized caspase-like protein